MSDDFSLAFHNGLAVKIGKLLLAVAPFTIALGYFGWAQNLAAFDIQGVSGVSERYFALGFLELAFLMFNLFVVVMLIMMLRTGGSRAAAVRAWLVAPFAGGGAWLLFLYVMDLWGAIGATSSDYVEAFALGSIFILLYFGMNLLCEWFLQKMIKSYGRESADRKSIMLTIPTALGLLLTAQAFPDTFGDQVPMAFGGADARPAIMQLDAGFNVTESSPGWVPYKAETGNNTPGAYLVFIHYMDDNSFFVRANVNGVSVGPTVEVSRAAVVWVVWPD